MGSARTAHRLRRLLSVVPYVLANPGVSVDDLCVRFGYGTRRELLGDLEVILVCGLPGYFPGDLIGAWVDGDEVVIDTADYFRRAPRLSPAEALMLVAGGKAVLATGVDVPALESGVAKLEKTLLGDDPVLAVDLGSEPAAAGQLREAIRDQRVVEIVYTSLSKGATTTRRVEPWAVFSTLGNWYVRAWCRMVDAERVFRLDRIRELTKTDQMFEPSAEPGPPEIRYTPSDDDVAAIIDLTPEATWVAEYYPVEELETAGEKTRIRFHASDPRVAARLLLRLGPAATLVSGDEVAAAAANLRSDIQARYAVASHGTRPE